MPRQKKIKKLNFFFGTTRFEKLERERETEN